MHTFSNTHIFTLASNNSLPLPFQFPFSFFLFLKKKFRTKHARRLFQPRIVSTRPRLSDPWKTTFNLPNNMEESQRAKGAQNFPVWSGPVLWPQTQYRKSSKRGGENLFCLRKRGNFSNSRERKRRISYFPRSKNKREHPVEAGVVHRVFHKRAENAWRWFRAIISPLDMIKFSSRLITSYWWDRVVLGTWCDRVRTSKSKYQGIEWRKIFIIIVSYINCRSSMDKLYKLWWGWDEIFAMFFDSTSISTISS